MYVLVRHTRMVLEIVKLIEFFSESAPEDPPYSMPLSKSIIVPSLLVSHHGATFPCRYISLLNARRWYQAGTHYSEFYLGRNTVIELSEKFVSIFQHILLLLWGHCCGVLPAQKLFKPALKVGR